MANKNIYLIRHTETYNPNKLCFGQSEMPLEENFTVQFDWIRERLQLNNNTIYYSSNLRRCAKLASYLSDDKFTVDQRVSDLNYGVWEMMEWAKIPTKELTAWNGDFVNYRIKKGESFLDLHERAIDFYEETVSNNESENIVLVTHAGVIRSIVSYVLEFPLEKVFNLQIDYSSLSKLSYSEELALSSISFLNLTAEHLKTVTKD
ncbi:histidine phosphatase family protein [Pedobacter arcticus]|uniref:histidine phosphatase family protein n=1 Tax=Pedobacter arcticus TaxID=752140 RepID=UPI0002EE9DD7|nr:histidine phosphatase family protein [Pedobacter arcticus]